MLIVTVLLVTGTALVVGRALLSHRLLLGDHRVVPSGPAGIRPSDVSVVVPARNEGTRLPSLLSSLAAQDHRPGEVIVVDDGSDDDTVVVARAAGCQVVSTDGPPPGWTGKAWACHTGAQRAAGSVLLFLDADTVLAPAALEGLLSLHSELPGLLSVQPYHQPARGYEQLSAYCNVVPLLASGAFSSWTQVPPMAFGPCLVTSRSDYLRSGGHAAARSTIVDDVGLARAYASQGLPVRCALGGSAVQMRMYPQGLRQLVEGWTKNLAAGARFAGRRPAAAATVWLCAHWFVAVGTVLAVWSAATSPGGHPGGVGMAALGVVAWLAIAAQLRWLLHQVGSFRWWTWVLFPVTLTTFGLLFAGSCLLSLGVRQVRWRGRVVPVSGAAAQESG